MSNKKKPTKIISTQEQTHAQQAYEKLVLIVAQAKTDFEVPSEELIPGDDDYKLAEIAMAFIKIYFGSLNSAWVVSSRDKNEPHSRPTTRKAPP